MNFEKIAFTNDSGYTLSGRLELPADGIPHNYAIFAHCFTCSKNFAATRNISRALTGSGYGVLRFDFTGLGDSDGDFTDTNFSGNVSDLLAAIDHMTAHYEAPTLLIGHSLGGAAAIYAAASASSIKAVATIAAPSDTRHVKQLFGDSLEAIIDNGEATVQLAGRPFKIKEQLVKDLNEQQVLKTLSNLRKPILIAHAPQDNTVSIQHAEKLYLAAMHPKSFISLDGTDHLLMNEVDAAYIGNVIAAWATKYLDIPKTPVQHKSATTVDGTIATLSDAFMFKTTIQSGRHTLIADEPLKIQGTDLGPTPYDLLSSGLAACTVMTLQMYARRKKWHITNVTCQVVYDKQHAQDCENCEDDGTKIDTFTRNIAFNGDLNQEQIDKLLVIADKCPVHKTLSTQTQILTYVASVL